MRVFSSKTLGIARSVVGIIVIVVIVLAGAGAYYYSGLGKASNTTSSTSSTSSGQSSTSASSTSSSSSTTGVARNTLTIDDVFWPGPQDQNQLTAIGEVPYPSWLTYTVYQPLVTLNASSLYSQGILQYLPVLASNWTVSSDQTTYTFNLRQGVKFSDGNPLNAYQIWLEMYGFYYLSGNSSGSFFESYNIFDFSHVNFGPATTAMINQTGGLVNPSAQAVAVMSNNQWPIYAPSANTIVFHLKAPFGYFLGTLVVYTGLIFDTQWLLDHGGFGTAAAINTFFNQNPIPGTGPYVVSGWSENSYIKFSKNPTYWGANLTAVQIAANPYIDPGHVQNVIVNAKSSDVARYTDLTTGQAQIAGILSQDYSLVLQQPNKFATFQFPDKAAVFVGVWLNTLKYPTNITAVRQAIVHAINYTDVSQKVFFGGLTPMMGPEYPIFSQFYDLGGLPPYNFNLNESKQILANAHIDPAKLPPMDFRVASLCSYCIDAAVVIENDLVNLGLSVNIVVTPQSQYGCPLTGGTCPYSTAVGEANQISNMGWYGTGTFAPAADTPADNWLLAVNNQTSSNNWALYSNPTVQKCVNAWTTTADVTQLINLCTAAQLQIYNDAPYTFLGTLKPLFGAGSIVSDKSVIKNYYVDPVFSGQSDTVIFNTVTFA